MEIRTPDSKKETDIEITLRIKDRPSVDMNGPDYGWKKEILDIVLKTALKPEAFSRPTIGP
jgi:hypothetical protein